MKRQQPSNKMTVHTKAVRSFSSYYNALAGSGLQDE